MGSNAGTPSFLDNRCVRRCFLCGEDPHTGANYDHRKAWLEQRLAFLAGQFGIDVLGFAILLNHLHLVLRNPPDVVATWSDTLPGMPAFAP